MCHESISNSCIIVVIIVASERLHRQARSPHSADGGFPQRSQGDVQGGQPQGRQADCCLYTVSGVGV